MSDELSAFDVIRTPTQSTPVGRMRDLLLSERAVIEAAELWAVEMGSPFVSSSAERLTKLEYAILDAVAKLRELRGK